MRILTTIERKIFEKHRQHEEPPVEDHRIHFEHLKLKRIREYGCPAVSISYHLRDVIEMREIYKFTW